MLLHLHSSYYHSDPDIEHLPFFAISPVFLSSLFSSYYKRTMAYDWAARYLIPLQHKLFYIVMAFGRFNLYANSYSFLINKAFDTKRARGAGWSWALEVSGIVFFWAWFGSVLIGCGTWPKALAYLIVSHVVTSPLHVQVCLSSGEKKNISSQSNTLLRSSCPTFPCPQQTSAQPSLFHTASSGRRQTSSAPPPSPSCTAASTSR